jgi:hypothetical protein
MDTMTTLPDSDFWNKIDGTNSEVCWPWLRLTRGWAAGWPLGKPRKLKEK